MAAALLLGIWSSAAFGQAAGSLDTTFDPGTGPDQAVGTVNQRSTDGKIFIGGNFTHVQGAARGGVALLDTNGTLDTGFAPTVGGFIGRRSSGTRGDRSPRRLRRESDRT